MGRFVEHTSCAKCGSRDNFGRYDDGGGFCFGCHYTEPATHAPMRHMGNTAVSGGEKYHHPLPEDCGHLYGSAAVEWLASFHMDVPTAIQHGVVWSPSREQLIFQLGNCWQARNFGNTGLKQGGKQRSKNFTSGDVNECLHIFSNVGRSNATCSTRLVIVEDPVSAIRVACSGGTGLPEGPWSDAMPLLGSHLATARLNAVAGLYQGAEIVFWLDSDKLKEARNMCERARYMGLSARVVHTSLDPKCYTNNEILEILK